MKAIGVDIGTTSISVVCIELETNELVEAKTIDNGAFIEAESYEKIQDPTKIISVTQKLLDEFIDKYSLIEVIGVTGQMHGILYLDKDGNSVSPLYTWQDESGNRYCDKDGRTYTEVLSGASGYKMATGFGLTTFFVHTRENKIPVDATGFSTIHDYLVMRLCRKSRSVTHSSDAASFGIFDLKNKCFDVEKIALAGMDTSFLPDVLDDFSIVGEYKNIPVSVAIGDNQASFLGAVPDIYSSVLVNVGTGSQLSFYTENAEEIEGMELRPLEKNGYLQVGSSLCGGRAFAIVEQFLRETAELISKTKIESAYSIMDEILDNERLSEPLEMNVRFNGTRENPQERGFIKNIGINNFNAENMIFAVVDGIVNELYGMYKKVDVDFSHLTGSGNGIRKNKALQRAFSEKFGLEMEIPSNREEAACGAVKAAKIAFERYKKEKC